MIPDKFFHVNHKKFNLNSRDFENRYIWE